MNTFKSSSKNFHLILTKNFLIKESVAFDDFISENVWEEIIAWC